MARKTQSPKIDADILEAVAAKEMEAKFRAFVAGRPVLEDRARANAEDTVRDGVVGHGSKAFWKVALDTAEMLDDAGEA